MEDCTYTHRPTLTPKLTLRTLTNQETGEVLFNLPSGLSIDNSINVLMMAVHPKNDCIIVKLMFMEPEPFLVETPQD